MRSRRIAQGKCHALHPARRAQAAGGEALLGEAEVLEHAGRTEPAIRTYLAIPKRAGVFRLAGERQKPSVLPALTARAGVLRSMSPQPMDTLSPSLTDGNSWAFSLGAGYNLVNELTPDPRDHV